MAISTAPFELGMPIVQNAFNAAVDSSEQRPVAAREPIAY